MWAIGRHKLEMVSSEIDGDFEMLLIVIQCSKTKTNLYTFGFYANGFTDWCYMWNSKYVRYAPAIELKF